MADDVENIEQPSPILTADQRIRLFVSSTIPDLKPERAATRAAIEDLKLHSVLFEPEARPHSAQDVYRALLAQSQIYIGIFGTSYGYVAPDMNVSGIEDEYNLSLSAGMPQFVYVKQTSEPRDERLDALLKRLRNSGNIVYSRFTTCEELADRIKNDVMLFLSERWQLASPPSTHGRVPVALHSYLQDLHVRMQGQALVPRERIVDALRGKLQQSRVLLLKGDPGIGKTFLLGGMGSTDNALYVSLRNKTTQQVCVYLGSHLASRRNSNIPSAPTEEEARSVLQEELAKSTALLLIDDVEQNAPVTQALVSLDYYENQVIFTTRSTQSQNAIYQDMAKFTVPAFNRGEVEHFLAIHEVRLPPGELQKVYDASRGNPLYLYYYTQHPTSPLPDSLAEYQRALWGQLSAAQQEIANLVAHFRHGQLNVADLHDLLEKGNAITGSPMETKQLLDAAAPLLRQVGGGYELFHPYFEEYVRSSAVTDGLSTHYHLMLAEHAIAKGWAVPTAYHLLQAEDSRLKDYVLQAVHAAMFRGEWPLAEEFTTRQAEIAIQNGDRHSEAYARYLLAQVYQELGRYADARAEADRAIQLFGETGDAEWKQAVEYWASNLLIEEGRGGEAIEMLDKAVEFYRDKDNLQEAISQIALSYACIQASLYRPGAKAAERALELFTEVGDEQGINAALINLACCAGGLDDNESQGKYAEQVIEIAQARGLPRLELAGLNHRARVQRLADDPAAAQRTLQRCIELSQKLGMVEKEVMNIANLGNALRDQKLDEQAQRAYDEALAKAREYKLPRQEAHALELLSRLKHEHGLYEESVNIGLEALAIHNQFGEYVRIASTQDYLARSYLKLGSQRDAAEGYEESGKNYETAQMWDYAAYQYGQASGLWSEIGEHERAGHCLSQSVQCALLDGEPEKAESILAEAPLDLSKDNVGQLYLQVLERFTQQPAAPTIVSFIYNFSAYCKRHSEPSEKECYRRGLALLCEVIKQRHDRNLINALAVGVEQANEELLPTSEIEQLEEAAAGVVEHLYYRAHKDGLWIWTVGLDWPGGGLIQLTCLSEEGIARRITMALALLIRGNHELIEDCVAELGGNLEGGLELQVCTKRDFEENVGSKIQPREPGKAYFAGLLDSETLADGRTRPAILILLDEYEQEADWMTHPENKEFVWVLMVVHGGIIRHFTHVDPSAPEYSAIAKKSRRFCESVLQGY
jgi:tetratricopeptide (TPR) repeat protein